LDSELDRRKPTERSHGKVVRTAVVDRELLCKIVQRIEVVTGIETLLVLTVAALDLAVVPRRIGTNEFVPNIIKASITTLIL